MLRLGIIGTGRIAKRFLKEAEYVENVAVTTVYNPHVISAIKFAEKSADIFAAESLSDFWNRCDVVYIASPHETHADYIEEALLNNKHVLCEKPMFLHKEDARRLMTLANSRSLVAMEAIKTKYCPGYKKLVEVAMSGMIGQIVDVDACFTKLENPMNRELVNIKYGGSFRELGSYTLLPIIDLLGYDIKGINFSSFNNENGIDLFTRAIIEYENANGSIKVGLGAKSEGQLIISGTKGYILARAPWWKTDRFEIRYEDPSKVDIYEFIFEGDGLRYELKEFCERVVNNQDCYFKNDEGNILIRSEIMELFGANR